MVIFTSTAGPFGGNDSVSGAGAHIDAANTQRSRRFIQSIARRVRG